MTIRLSAVALLMIAPLPAAAQVVPGGATLTEMATTPVIRLNISEALRSPPDEATITVGTQARAMTATEASALNKAKTERLLATIRAAGLRERDIQTQGINLSPEYNYVNDPASGRGRQVFNGYVASNSVQVKTRDIPRLTALLDRLTSAGADTVYGPSFSIGDPLPIRAEARKRALVRGAAEALEYARASGFSRVTLLSVEEGTSYRGSDIVVTGARMSREAAPPPPPPPPVSASDSVVAPGQLETSVSLGLLYRMER